MQPNVCVVHLIWIPYGIKLFEEFVDSYQTYNAGYPHQLILLFNGISDEQESYAYHSYIKTKGIAYQPFYFSNGQDLQAYRYISEKLTCDYIIFLNSYSRFQAPKWLQKFVSALENKDVGLVGATGSWQSYYSTIFEKNSWYYTKFLSLAGNIKKYKLLIKTLFLWRFYFKQFPNPHVRTNAFLINRKTFLSLKISTPKDKFEAYKIESGRNSITQQILKLGLKVLLVDKLGNNYHPDQWISSNIFWNAKQENLLIADNQTNLYINSSLENQRLLRKIAWGINL